MANWLSLTTGSGESNYGQPDLPAGGHEEDPTVITERDRVH
jgi:hypothetical protein